MLLTRSPLSPKSASTPWIPFDLHVLSTPPAFILSQDQTLQQKPKTTHQKQQAQKNDPTKKPDQKWFKPENNPAKTNTNNQKTKRSKIISIKKTKTRKNQTHPKKTRQAQSNPTQTKQKNTLSRTQTTKPQTNQKQSVKVTARKTRESQSNRFDFRLSTYF